MSSSTNPYLGTPQCSPVNGTLPGPSQNQVHLPPGTHYAGFEYPVLLSDISSKCCANGSQLQYFDNCYQYCPVNNGSAFGYCVVGIHPELNGTFAWSTGIAVSNSSSSGTALSTARHGMTTWSAVILGLVLSSWIV